MSRNCTICFDPRVQAIDGLLAAGRSTRSVATEYELSPEAMKRHARNHVAEAVAVAAGGTDPLDELVAALRERALGVPNAGLAREYRLAILARDQRQAVAPAEYNVLKDPEWLRLRTTILVALKPYPEAQYAVADAIGASEPA